MRALIFLSAVAIALSSCASIEEDNSIHVQDIDRVSSGSYNASNDQSPSHHVKSFTVVASYDAIKGYGPDPKHALEAITLEIIASHGFCPNGYSIGSSPHIGTYRTVNWQIICNE
jgi:hypothetical protein